MEFTIVSSHRGDSFNEHMQSMKFEFVHPEYLIHMRCESVEEYAKSIVHASCQIEPEQFTRLARQIGFLKNHGRCVFRHVKSMRTAIIHFTMDIVCTNSERHRYGLTLIISKVTHIDWQKNDEIASWCGHVEARICLDALTNKTVIRDDMKYLACPLCQVPPMTEEIKEQLKVLKCLFGVNVAYDSGTHRSVLIVKSALTSSKLKVEHSNMWIILGCGTNLESLNYLESSPEFRSWLGCPDERLRSDFYGTMSEYHTAAQNQDILTNVFPSCLSLQIGEKMQCTIRFIVNDKVEDVDVTAHRLRSVVIIVLYRKDAL